MANISSALFRSATIVGAMLLLQASCYSIDRGVGQVSSWLFIVALIVAAALAGRVIGGNGIAASLYGTALGWLSMQIEWIFLTFLLVQVLRTASEESMVWGSVGFSLFTALAVALCTVSAAVSARLSKNQDKS